MKKAIINRIEVKYDKRGCKLENCGFIDADILYVFHIGKDEFKYKTQAIVHIDGEGWPADIFQTEVQNQDNAIRMLLEYAQRNSFPDGLDITDMLSITHEKHLEIVQAISKKEPYSIKL